MICPALQLALPRLDRVAVAVAPHRCTTTQICTYYAGLDRIKQEHPTGVTVHVGGVDNELDSAGFLVPGIGDAGDRLFSTAPPLEKTTNEAKRARRS